MQKNRRKAFLTFFLRKYRGWAKQTKALKIPITFGHFSKLHCFNLRFKRQTIPSGGVLAWTPPHLHDLHCHKNQRDFVANRRKRGWEREAPILVSLACRQSWLSRTGGRGRGADGGNRERQTRGGHSRERVAGRMVCGGSPQGPYDAPVADWGENYVQQQI